MMQLQIPRGTRDFAPEQMRKRQYVLDILRRTFESYAYDPLETPAMEMKHILLGKYGDEGDKLIFKILDNGEIAHKVPANTLIEQVPNFISEKALRYDLTIPMARFVAMHANSLPLPFKRYQMQAVWRGDKPQKGRYREFYQCDVDIVGSDSLLCEAELLAIYAQVFRELRIPKIQIQINSRKILQALIQQIGAEKYANTIITNIDKIDKIGKDAVLELCKKYLPQPETLAVLADFLAITGDNTQIIQRLEILFAENTLGKQGLSEISEILQLVQAMDLQCEPEIVTHLARGIDYYTGMIVEIKTKAMEMGSLGGGGRYQNIAGSFGVEGINGVGISFGLDRICDVLENLDLFPQSQAQTSLLFVNLYKNSQDLHQQNILKATLAIAQKLRNQGIACMLYPEPKKITKQFKYAEKKAIPYLVFLGEEEFLQGQAKIKNIYTGKQILIDLKADASEWQNCFQSLL